MQKIFPRACERFDKICCARGENRRPMCDVTRGITELRRRAALTSQSLLFLSRLRTLYSRHSQNASRCESLRNFTSRRGTRRTCGTERERERENESALTLKKRRARPPWLHPPMTFRFAACRVYRSTVAAFARLRIYT